LYLCKIKCKSMGYLGVQQRILEKYGKDITLCPCCKIGRLVIVYTKRFGTKPITNQSLNRFIEYKPRSQAALSLNFATYIVKILLIKRILTQKSERYL